MQAEEVYTEALCASAVSGVPVPEGPDPDPLVFPKREWEDAVQDWRRALKAFVSHAGLRPS